MPKSAFSEADVGTILTLSLAVCRPLRISEARLVTLAHASMTDSSAPPESLLEAAVRILNTADPWVKADLSTKVAEVWRSGSMPVYPAPGAEVMPPSRPSRSDDKVKIVTPGMAPKRGNGGSLASRQALLHSLCHIENWAVDLSWDIIARFGNQADYELPRDFFDDFVTVAEDETRHFLKLEARLNEVGSHYGALPAHDGLWDSASKTAHSLPARLAVESCVHEARGLDVLPGTIAKFRNNKDEPTASLLEQVIYPEEINHCKAGVRWFRYLHELAHRRYGDQPSSAPLGASSETPGGAQHQSTATHDAQPPAEQAAPRPVPEWAQQALKFQKVEEWFHDEVGRHFWGSLKPPFNEAAREKAGFDRSWYLPLVAVTAKHK